MDTMETVVLVIHTLIALLLIGLVLLQRGKGADAGAAFGAGASGTVFGARGSSNFFSRATAVLATAFFATSLALAYMSSQHHTDAPKSLIENAPAVQPDETATDTPEDTQDAPELPPLPDDEATGNDAEAPTDTGELPALAPDEPEPADDENQP